MRPKRREARLRALNEPGAGYEFSRMQLDFSTGPANSSGASDPIGGVANVL
jgi:hypothetical protein